MDPPDKIPDWVPSDIKELLANLLDKDPTKRKSISEIQRWLFLRQEPPEAASSMKDDIESLKAQISQLSLTLLST